MNQPILPLNGKYFLEAFLDHKEKYQLTDDIEISISKSFENNLRERNPQMGLVTGVPEENPLNLKIGDTVITHHLAFYGDIADDKGFTKQEHFIHEGKTYFVVSPERIFATYNNKEIKCIGDFVFCHKMDKENPSQTIIIPDAYKDDTNRAVVFAGSCDVMDGDVLILPDNAIYPITIDKKELVRIYIGDIFAIVRDGILFPYSDYFIAEDLDNSLKSDFLDLSLVKSSHVYSVVKQVGSKCWTVKVGDKVYRVANSGLKYKNVVILNDDHYSIKVDENNQIRQIQ